MSISYQKINATIKTRLVSLTESSSVIGDDTDIVNELGLDSLKLMDLLMDIEDEFDVSIPMNALIDTHTVKDLCNKIYELSNR